MKKLLLLLLLATIGMQAQMVTKNCKSWQFIKRYVEVNGHISKKEFIFETDLKGVKICNRDSKQGYSFKDCEEKDCKIINLEIKDNVRYAGIKTNLIYN